MTKWLRQYWGLSRTAFVVTLGTPFSLVLMLSILGFMAVLGSLPAFTFGEQLRLIRDQSLALAFIGGCLAVTLGAGKNVADDLHRGPASVILSRPVSSLCYLAGKWTGIVSSVAVIQAAACIGTLWLTRITQHEEAFDATGMTLYLAALALALGAVAVKHYLFGGCYVWQANVTVLAVLALGFLLNLLIGPATESVARHVDWKTAQAALMIFFALVVYSGVVTLFSVLADTALLLGLSVLLFFGGLISDYLLETAPLLPFLRLAGKTMVPRWQPFWINDTLAAGMTAPWNYVAVCGVYAALYAAASLLAAAALFNRREMSGY